jgi:outer membrane protein assembly factor BamB
MQRGLQRCRHLSLVWASIAALLGVVACGDAGPRHSIFTQQPQQGSGEAITLQTAEQIHLLWTYQPGNGFAQSIISANGIVYVSYMSDVSVVGAAGNTGNITPTVSGGSVSVLDAIDAHSGRRLWRFQAPELPDFGVSPLVANETIYFALTYHICALNARDGAVRWCKEVIDRSNDEEYIVDGELAFEDGMLFVGAYHTLIAVDATTGKRVWRVQTPMHSSHLVTGDGLVYVSAVTDGQLSAFDASTGQLVWRATQPPFPINWAPVPFLDEGTLYVLSGRTLAAYDGRRGDQLWRVSVDGGEYGGNIDPPSPVFANIGGTPYMLAFETNVNSLFNSFSTQLVAYNLETHQQAWSKGLEGQGGQALAVRSGAVYVASTTIDHAYPSPSDRHYWLTMMDLHTGQVARQLQNNDASFEIRQLLGDGGRLFVLGAYVTGGYGSRVFALGQ